MIPNEYLYYYDFNAEALEAMKAGRVRSAFLERQQAAFYAGHGLARRGAARLGAEPMPSASRTTWRRPGPAARTSMAGIVAARGPGDYGRLALTSWTGSTATATGS